MNHSPLLHGSCLFIATLVAALPARADIIVEQDTTISNRHFSLNAGHISETYLVNDGVTLAFDGSFTVAGGVFTLTPGSSLSLGPNPAAPLGNGQIEFRDISSNSNAGAIFSENATLHVTNVRFLNIRATSSGGAITANGADAVTVLSHVEFIGNSAGNSGAIRNLSGTLTGNDLRFEGNFGLGSAATNGSGGAFGQSNAGAYAKLGDAVFASNRVRWDGGAIWLSNGDITLDNPVFIDNWAGRNGGAILGGSGRSLFFNITASGTVTNYLYSGNRAGGLLPAAATEVATNAPLFTPSAAAGGFLHLSGVAAFDIGASASLTIGIADAADKAVDSIAGPTGGRLLKAGAGDLVLNADNSAFNGTTTISVGRLMLGNGGAKLGGTITVGAGATFGGAGTVSVAAGTSQLNINLGAILQVGLADRAEESFAITGGLALNNATVAFVAFGGTHATKLELASAAAATGTTRLDLRFFKSGSYNLGALVTGNKLGANVVWLANGADISASSRQSITDVSSNGDLILNFTADQAREMTWTGAAGAVWNSGGASWVDDGEPASGITEFAGGDAVAFANAGAISPVIMLADYALVTAMTVDESGTLTFAGAGGITGVAYFQNDVRDAGAARAGSGKLVKNGAGTLKFENTGGNRFDGGIEINDGGVIEFSRGNQLQTGTAAIVFNASGMLRPDASVTLDNNITAAGEGVVVTIDTSSGDLTHAGGVISGAGVLRKQGAGMLALNTANTIAGVELAGGVLSIGHAKALGTGALEVTGDGATLEIASGVTVANAVRFTGRELAVRAAGGGALAGALAGDRLRVRAGSGILALSGNNSLNSVMVQSGGTTSILSSGALGGAVVRVQSGGALGIGADIVAAGDTTIESGGALGFTYLRNPAAGPRLSVNGTLELEAGSIVSLEKTPSAKIWLAHASDDVLDSGATLIGAHGSGPARLLAEGRDLYALNVNWDANPGKDIAAALDALTALGDAVRARVQECFLLPLVDRKAGDPEKSFWIRTFATFADHDGDAVKTGYKDETYGLLAGYDKILGESFLVGGYAGYSYSMIRTDNRAETDAQQPFAGLYASYRTGWFYLTADATAGTLDTDTLREEGTPDNRVTGAYKALTFGAGAEIGAVIQQGPYTVLRPSVGVRLMNYRFSDHHEFSPGGAGALVLDDFTARHLEGLAGLRFSRKFRTPWALPGAVDLFAGWRRVLSEDDAPLGVSFANSPGEHVMIERARYSRDRVILGVGLRLAVTRRASLSLTYDYEAGGDSVRDTIAAGMAWSW